MYVPLIPYCYYYFYYYYYYFDYYKRLVVESYKLKTSLNGKIGMKQIMKRTLHSETTHGRHEYA